MKAADEKTRCGYVGLIGRPNVGKSTLLNRLVGEKISITADKPQTTRHSILGIQHFGQTQIIYVDTPGIHGFRRRRLNQLMNRSAAQTLEEVDVVLWMVEASHWTEEDTRVGRCLEAVQERRERPIFLVLNKIDLLKDKRELLPILERLRQDPAVQGLKGLMGFFPISAEEGVACSGLAEAVVPHLPEGPFLFASTDKTSEPLLQRFSEIVREKLTRSLGQELPYALHVHVEAFEPGERLARLWVQIWVERASQKAIVIGKGGARLKQVGSKARRDIEVLLGKQLDLQIWVRVEPNWPDDPALLQQAGLWDRPA